jgi:hypothetical protein
MFFSASKSGLVGSSAESAKAVKDEVDRINKQYGASGQNFEEFPTFKFEGEILFPVGTPSSIESNRLLFLQEPKLDPITQVQADK